MYPLKERKGETCYPEAVFALASSCSCTNQCKRGEKVTCGVKVVELRER